MIRRIALCFLVLWLGIVSSSANTSTLPNFADTVEPLIPAVVNVYTAQHRKQVRTMRKSIPHGFPFDQFRGLFEQFEIPLDMNDVYQDNKSSLGSGFIIDSEGYIVTNHHVIDGADEIYIKLGDGLELKAKLIGSDKRTDLALLKVEHKNPLPFVKFGDSNIARVGDWIIAIGNPFGLGGTVTVGIISSKSRDIPIAEAGIVDDFLQTDAAINIGNSGGPMFNIQGEVIGVNTAIFSPNTGTNIGIGFAIPSSTVLNIIQQLKEHGKVIRGLLNIKIQDVTAEIAEGLGLSEPSGTLVFDVENDGAGAKAGLKSGDVIIEFNNEPVKNARKLQIAVAATAINTDAKIVVMRSGKKYELKCHITEDDKKHKSARDESSDTTPVAKGSIEKHGIVFSDLSEELIKLFDLKSNDKGVVVSGFKNSDTRWQGFARGDIVVSVNQQPVSTIREFENIYTSAIKHGRKNIVLLVRRQGAMLFMAMPLAQ